MRRADRLFQIVERLRRCKRSAVTAAQLAEQLDVSERTIYRDFADLSISGVPIRAEAGVGYVLDRGFDVPPLMFEANEIEALSLGARMVAAYSDADLAKAAESALAKIEAVVPEALKTRLLGSRLFAPTYHLSTPPHDLLVSLRRAIDTRRHVRFVYQRQDGEVSERSVRPLCLAFVIPHWMLSAWCELRHEFRNFRLDRITRLRVCSTSFVEEPGKSLVDFIRHVEQEAMRDKGLR
jgi:predicted DNA-binding transcriptional regulator YafY